MPTRVSSAKRNAPHSVRAHNDPIRKRAVLRYGSFLLCFPFSGDILWERGERMDREKFQAARQTALDRTKGESGIGTLSEKALHAALKAYYEPDAESREIALGSFVADIVGEDGIIEIQTRGFERLREKLDAFLEFTRVTVVYPIVKQRWLCWVDPETGEVTPKKKSPKKEIPFDVFPELYKLKKQMQHPNFTLRLAVLESTDYKYLDGYGAQRKIRASRGERVPDELLDEIDLHDSEDYLTLLPENLEEPFTTKMLAKAVKRPVSHAQAAVNVLYTVGALERVGREKNTYLYRRKV